MGYDLHITRQENWSDDDESRQISLSEWTQIINNDSEMSLEKYAETVTAKGEVIRHEMDGLAAWTSASGSGLNGKRAWLYHSLGNIVCKNPDDEIISKMIEIAGRLNAKVQGDEGEIYMYSSDNKIDIITPGTADINEGNKKPWWKFW